MNVGHVPNLPRLRHAINEESREGSVRDAQILSHANLPASVPPPEKDPKEQLIDKKDLDRVLSRDSIGFGS